MNLSLENNTTTTTNTSSWELLDITISLQDMFSDVVSGYQTLEHLCAIQKTIKQYGCTESLMSLYGDNNITFSVESIGEAIQKAWNWIKEKVKALYDIIVGFIKRLFNVNNQAKAAVDKIEDEAKKASGKSTKSHEALETGADTLMGVSAEAYQDLLKFLTESKRVFDDFDKLLPSVNDESSANTVMNKVEEAVNSIKDNFESKKAGWLEFKPITPDEATRRAKRLQMLVLGASEASRVGMKIIAQFKNYCGKDFEDFKKDLKIENNEVAVRFAKRYITIARTCIVALNSFCAVIMQLLSKQHKQLIFYNRKTIRG